MKMVDYLFIKEHSSFLWADTRDGYVEKHRAKLLNSLGQILQKLPALSIRDWKTRYLG